MRKRYSEFVYPCKTNIQMINKWKNPIWENLYGKIICESFCFEFLGVKFQICKASDGQISDWIKNLILHLNISFGTVIGTFATIFVEENLI